MKTACPKCRAAVLSRVWDMSGGLLRFLETYECGGAYWWGHLPRMAAPCPTSSTEVLL